MQVLTPGHRYFVSNFEDRTNGQTIQFIEKVIGTKLGEYGLPIDASSDSTALYTVHDGTTNEDILEVLIDRLKFLNDKFPCKENACAITHLQEAENWLNRRTAERKKRGVEGKQVL